MTSSKIVTKVEGGSESKTNNRTSTPRMRDVDPVRKDRYVGRYGEESVRATRSRSPGNVNDKGDTPLPHLSHPQPPPPTGRVSIGTSSGFWKQVLQWKGVSKKRVVEVRERTKSKEILVKIV